MRGIWAFRACALLMLSVLLLAANGPIHRVPAVFRVMAAWPAVAGVVLLLSRKEPSGVFLRLTRLLAVLSLLWTVVWALLWFTALGFNAQTDVRLVQRLGWFNLAAIGAGAAAILYFSRDKDVFSRMAGYWAVTGWCVAYVSWVNLLLEPSWGFFLGPALGGVLLVPAGVRLHWKLKKQ
jgi:hypothetical protein